MKFFSGYTEKTMENIMINAGVLFKNFNVGEDTFDSAKAAGKLLGDTQGGSTFKATVQLYTIETDGAPTNTKGQDFVDYWDVSLGTTLAETTAENIKLALGAAKIDSATNEKYDVITGKTEIEDDDYLENITMISTITGSDDPVIIQVFNVLNKDGLEIKTEKKNGATLAATFTGHYSADKLTEPPYKIYYPKVERK